MGSSRESFQYDDEGKLLISVDSQGRTTRYVYDPRGNLVEKFIDDLNEADQLHANSARLYRLLISYSRIDGKIVRPLVALLSIADERIFIDIGIRPGSRWRAVLADAINDCEFLLLFWCCHSSPSAEVKREYEQAIAAGKIVVPVLLDDTPLNSELAQYQAVDLRGALGKHEGYVDVDDHLAGARPGSEEKRISRRWEVLLPDRESLADAYQHLSSILVNLLHPPTAGR